MIGTHTPTGWYAVFTRDGSAEGSLHRAVEAWSADGEALVVSESDGALAPARTQPGFAGLRPGRRIVGVIPAGDGWTKTFNPDPDEGEPDPWSLPIIGWLVDDTGEVSPVLPLENLAGDPVPGRRLGGPISWPGKADRLPVQRHPAKD
jgi:hypothetical protein